MTRTGSESGPRRMESQEILVQQPKRVKPCVSLRRRKKPIGIRKLGGSVQKDRVQSLCGANRCPALQLGWVICLSRICTSAIVSCRPGPVPAVMRSPDAGLFAVHSPCKPPRDCACPPMPHLNILYAPGQVIVDTRVHAHSASLRLRIRSVVRTATGVGDKVARRSVFGNQQAWVGSAVGYCSSTRGLEVRHARCARGRSGGGGSRGVYRRHRKMIC